MVARPSSAGDREMLDESARAYATPMADEFAAGLDYSGTSDSSDQLREACRRAFEIGHRTLRLPPGRLRVPRLGQCPDIVLIGHCELLGTDRKRCVAPHAQPVALGSDVEPSLHLRRFHTAVAEATDLQPARIAMVGDSWTVGPAQTLSAVDTWPSILAQRLRRCFGAAPIEIGNFGIGGTMWRHFHQDAAPPVAGERRFYDNAGRSWRSYVEAFDPDWVIIGFGMNDGYSADPAAIHEVIQRIRTLRKSPSVTICVNCTPSLGLPDDEYPDLTNSRDFAAGLARSYAVRHGIGFIDWHRAQLGVREGFDPRRQTLRVVELPHRTVHLPFRVPVTTGDFSIRAVFLSGDDLWKLGPLPLQLSAHRGNAVRLDRDAATNCLAVTVNTTESLVCWPRRVTGVPAPAGKFTLEIACRDGWLNVAVDGETVFAEYVVRFGGAAQPVLGGPDHVETSAIMSRVCVGIPHPTMPSVIDRDLWGGVGARRAKIALMPDGGNGYNHLSSIGTTVIIRAALDATRLV